MDYGVNGPETLRSTKVRKHVVSVSQILNFKNNELDLLEKFMGHDIRIHRELYKKAGQCTAGGKVVQISDSSGKKANYLNRQESSWMKWK